MGDVWVPDANWTRDEMQVAIVMGHHHSALLDEAIAHFRAKVEEKVRIGQAKLVAWDSLKDNPPPELKILPIAVIPHKFVLSPAPGARERNPFCQFDDGQDDPTGRN